MPIIALVYLGQVEELTGLDQRFVLLNDRLNPAVFANVFGVVRPRARLFLTTAKHGFRCYRGTTPDRWYDRTPFRRAGKFVDWGIGASAPPIVSPTVDEHGLVNIPASLYLFDFEGPPRVAVETVFDNPVIRQVERGLERLQHEQEGVFHLWFHPNNMTTRQDHDRMRAIISLIAEYRDRHGIQIETMEQVSERVLDGG